jgi:hypothetical protein
VYLAVRCAVACLRDCQVWLLASLLPLSRKHGGRKEKSWVDRHRRPPCKDLCEIERRVGRDMRKKSARRRRRVRCVATRYN